MRRLLLIIFACLLIGYVLGVCYAGVGESVGKKTGEVWDKAVTITESTADKVKDSYNRNAPKVEEAIESGVRKVENSIKRGAEKVKKEVKDFSTGLKGSPNSQ